MNDAPGFFAPLGGLGRAAPLIEPIEPPAEFTFTWMDIPFQGLVEKDEDGRPWLRLRGNLGPVPFSAENIRRRARLIALSGLEIVDQARFRITPEWELNFLHRASLDDPITQMSILGQTTALLAQAKPYLDLAARGFKEPREA